MDPELEAARKKVAKRLLDEHSLKHEGKLKGVSIKGLARIYQAQQKSLQCAAFHAMWRHHGLASRRAVFPTSPQQQGGGPALRSLRGARLHALGLWRLVLKRVGVGELRGRLESWHGACQQRRHAAQLFLRPLSTLYLSLCHAARLALMGRAARCWQLRARLASKVMWQVSSKRLLR